jgi:hypothetical protein
MPSDITPDCGSPDLTFSRSAEKRRREPAEPEDAEVEDGVVSEKDDMNCRGSSGADTEDASGGRGDGNSEENDWLPIV